MTLSYEEFKERNLSREFGDFHNLRNLISRIDHVINGYDIKFFYPRNVHNQKENELIFFFDNAVIIATYQDDKAEIKLIKEKIKSVHLSFPNYAQYGFEITMLFENGFELKLNSVEDSNQYLYDDYAEAVLQLSNYLIKH